MTISDYLRRRATGTRTADGRPKRIRCEHTGAMIFAPHPELPPLSTESVREMLAVLAEFP